MHAFERQPGEAFHDLSSGSAFALAVTLHSAATAKRLFVEWVASAKNSAERQPEPTDVSELPGKPEIRK